MEHYEYDGRHLMIDALVAGSHTLANQQLALLFWKPLLSALT